MTGDLRAQQEAALSAYRALLTGHPDLFTGRERRPIITDPDVVERYARQTGTVLGVASATPYGWLLNDLVQSTLPDGRVVTHPYLRMIAPPDGGVGVGVVVVATVQAGAGEERVVLVHQERHATGVVELELPRGFGAPGATAAQDALRELAEETGYVGDEAIHLGTTLTDSGLSDGKVAFFHVPNAVTGSSAPEGHEAIEGVVLLTLEELWSRFAEGTLRDGFTIQGIALYQRSVEVIGR